MRLALLAAAMGLIVSMTATGQTAPAPVSKLEVPAGVDADAFCFVVMADFASALKKNAGGMSAEQQQSVINVNNATTMYLVGVLSRRGDADIKAQIGASLAAFVKLSGMQKADQVQACLAIPRPQLDRVFDLAKNAERR